MAADLNLVAYTPNLFTSSATTTSKVGSPRVPSEDTFPLAPQTPAGAFIMKELYRADLLPVSGRVSIYINI